jgi:7-cyano-7-deazaguanine synthase
MMPMETEAPAVVLLSGGVDSSVLLHHVARALGHAPVHAISFNYGQRHARELDCARWQAAAVGVASHRVIDLSFLAPLLQAGSTLIAGGAAVPDLSELDAAALTQPPTYVPNRNMMLLSMAAAYAEANGVHDVFYGAQAQDEYGYWDCTIAFLERMNAVLDLNRKTPVQIHAPFVRDSKAVTVQRGLALGVDFAHTWSCYRGGEKACGTCPTCVERVNAFAACGARDPLEYAMRLA